MTAAHSTARAVYLPNGTLAITFPYRAWLVDDIKRLIPAGSRAYDADTRTWLISNELATLAIQILEREFGEVDVERGSSRRTAPTPIRKADSEYSEMHLLPTAPGYVVEAVFRAMAKANHPDRGGSTEAMKRLNLAYEALQRKAGAA